MDPTQPATPNQQPPVAPVEPLAPTVAPTNPAVQTVTAGTPPVQPVQTATPLGSNPVTPAAPTTGTLPGSNPNLLNEIAKKTKTTGTLSVVVASINFVILLLLVIAGQDIQINWVTTILSIAGVVGLFIFGLKLRQLAGSQDVPAIKQTIQLRLFPVMGVLIILSAISGGGIGLLPLLIIVFAGQALRKINQYQKG